MTSFIRILLLLSVFMLSPTCSDAQQDQMFKQKKERKKVWRRWRSKREAYNPYLEKKSKDKPSARMTKGNKREMKRQKRMYKKQMKRNKKTVNS